MTDKDNSVTQKNFNPSGNPAVDEIKARTEDLISFIEENVEPGSRRSLALTNYEQAAMWAVKAAVVGD